jgi:hypothetical protein
MTEVDKTPTPRGFANTEFEHHLYGPEAQKHYPHMSGKFSVQASSLADEHKVWIGFTQAVPTPPNPRFPELEGPVDRAQLSEEEALVVANALLEWLADEGEYAQPATLALSALGKSPEATGELDLDEVLAEHHRLSEPNFPEQGHDWRTPVMKLMDRIPALVYELAARRDRHDAILEAWTEAGSHPDYHRGRQRDLRRTWPVLAQALDDATNH